MTEPNARRLSGAQLPPRIADLPSPPEELYLVGELPRGPSVALVGTRRPTPEAVRFVSTLVADFVQAGYCVWSGGAEGIDAAVHRAALALHARTVVVAPAGWTRPYPEEHGALFREVVSSGGAYLSLVPCDRVAHPHQFFARNALLVALTHATIVVQAPIRSGARNAAKAARALGRPLFVVPSCPWVHQGLGCNLELGLGARPVGSAKEVLARLAPAGWCGATATSGACADQTLATAATAASSGDPTRAGARKRRAALKHAAELSPEQRQLLEEVAAGANSVDVLCLKTGWSPSAVQSVLLHLTLQCLVRVGRSGEVEIASA